MKKLWCKWICPDIVLDNPCTGHLGACQQKLLPWPARPRQCRLFIEQHHQCIVMSIFAISSIQVSVPIYESAVILFLIVACVAILVSCLGCCGAYKEIKWMLTVVGCHHPDADAPNCAFLSTLWWCLVFLFSLWSAPSSGWHRSPSTSSTMPPSSLFFVLRSFSLSNQSRIVIHDSILTQSHTNPKPLWP